MSGNSVIWTKALRSNSECIWSSESDIQGYIRDVIGDLLVVVGLDKKVSCFNELGIHNIRPDIWIVVTLTGVPIGVVEVKKPKTLTTEKLLTDKRVYGQIFDYMKKLETFTGLVDTFGIITTYEEWIFCSLKYESFSSLTNDEEKNYLRTKVIDFPTSPIEICTQSFSKSSKCELSLDILSSPKPTKTQHNYRRNLFGIHIPRDDKNLLPVFADILLKMFRSLMNPVRLHDQNRCYIEISSTKWSWCCLKNDFKGLNFSKFPSTKATSFLLLYDFRGGADGRVWLACSLSGCICVIKFYNGNYKLDDFNRECSIWNNVWNLPARIISLCSTHPIPLINALLMPYIYCYPENEVLNSEELLNAVKEAVQILSSKYYYHDDLHWNHVGFIHIKEVGKKAIFIDLIRVKKHENINIESLSNNMLYQLGLTKNKININFQSKVIDSPYKEPKK